MADGSALSATWRPSGVLTVTHRATDYTTSLQDITNGVASPIGNTEGALHANWSPDGTRVAFDFPDPTAGTSRSSIKVLDPISGALAEIVGFVDDNESPAWSSDGQSIYYSRDPIPPGGGTTRPQINRVPATGGVPAVVFADAGFNSQVAVSVTAPLPVRVLSGMSYDFTRDGHADVVSRTAAGYLMLYYGNGSRIIGSRVIGSGWQGFTDVFSPGDFNHDGWPDIIGRTAAGALVVYLWNGTRFGSSHSIGTGFGAMVVMFSPGDFTGDGRPDVLARSVDGVLRLYLGTGTALRGPVVIGPGWAAYTALFGIGDVTGDGRGDLLGRTPDGALLILPGTGTGIGAGFDISAGYADFTAFDGSLDFTGDRAPDFLARTRSGGLDLYNAFPLRGPSIIGSGWGR